MRWMRVLAVCLIALTWRAAADAPQYPPETVPGVVISHVPQSEKQYVGSPSLAILPDGSYVASHDLFGPASGCNEVGITRVFRSDDRGVSWKPTVTLKGQFWSTLFMHRGALYLLGTSRRFGDVVIRRSKDGGVTWTEPANGTSGLLSQGVQYHCAPVPVTEYGGRLWRAMEQRDPAKDWGVCFRAGMLSVPADADLLDAGAWTFSNFLNSDTAWLEKDFGGWLEGNALATPDGRIIDLLRVETKKYPERAAVVRISADGKTASFDPGAGFIEMPGGAKKFTVRYDPESKLYWSMANEVLVRHQSAGQPGGIRNMLALICSADLVTWQTRCITLYHPATAAHAFQYTDWQFDGDDIVVVSRTAYDDEAGGAHNGHDANFMTFHRVPTFRARAMTDSVPLYEPRPQRVETAHAVVTGKNWTLAILDEKALAFSNRKYVWLEVPQRIRGWRYTRLSGGVTAEVQVEPRRNMKVCLAASRRPGLDVTGWDAVPDLSFCYNDGGKTRVQVYTKALKAGETVTVPQGNWAGGMLLLPEP